MISVGIDISKGKSTVCFMKLYGEIMCSKDYLYNRYFENRREKYETVIF